MRSRVIAELVVACRNVANSFVDAAIAPSSTVKAIRIKLFSCIDPLWYMHMSLTFRVKPIFAKVCDILSYHNLGNSDSNKTLLGKAGACEAVVEALRKHVSSAAVAVQGCMAIGSLSYDDSNNGARLAALGSRDLLKRVSDDEAMTSEVREIANFVLNYSGD